MIGDLLAGAGLVATGCAASVAILTGPSRLRSAAMLAALLLAPVLILGDQWNSTLIADLRHSPGKSAALAAAAAAVVAILFLLFRRRPELLPLAIVAVLPFRIPLHAGGDQANLLVPLYLVIAAGALQVTFRDWRTDGGGTARAGLVGGAGGGVDRAVTPAGDTELGDRPEERPHRRGGGTNSVAGPAGLIAWLPRLLALFVIVYTLQALYSADFSKGLQNVCFFIAPFSVVFALLRELRWDRRLLTAALAIMAAEGLIFSLVGFVEYAVRDLLWNDAVIRSNEFHVYFRVNSLFWDPNVYGRYLAIVIVLVVAALLWTRRLRPALLLAGISLVLWLGLATTFSLSSFAALLAGLATLSAMRWSLRWTLAVCAAAALIGIGVALAAGSSLKIDLSTDNEVNKETTGRFNLASGGLDLFGNRPVWGYGSGSFSKAFRKHVAKAKPPVSESHTEPITVAAEQGIIGLLPYIALLAVALATLCMGLRGTMPGLSRGPPALASDSPAGGTEWGDQSEERLHRRAGGPHSVTGPAGQSVAGPAARAAVLAAFIALLVHTMAYAGFFEDPITWVLLAVGASLAAAGSRASPTEAVAPARDPVRAPA